MNYGFVYVLRNESMPGVYKIGFTDRSPLARCAELSGSTSVPTAFDLVAYGEVAEPRSVEARLHRDYLWARVSTSREFFSLCAGDALILLAGLKDSSINFCCCDAIEQIKALFHKEKLRDAAVRRSQAIQHFMLQSSDDDGNEQQTSGNDWWQIEHPFYVQIPF